MLTDDDLIRRAAEKMADSVGSQAFKQPGLAWDGFRLGWLGYATAALSVVEPELQRAEKAEAALTMTRERLDALIAAGFGATTDTLRELRAALDDTTETT